MKLSGTKEASSTHAYSHMLPLLQVARIDYADPWQSVTFVLMFI
jgi:hypothetical protein